MRPPRPYQQQKAQNSWPADQGDESKIPATYYMTDGRRALGKDDEEDYVICVLEAAARVSNGQKLVIEGQNHSSSVVQWTANRLHTVQRR